MMMLRMLLLVAAFAVVAELEVPDLKDEDGDGNDDVSGDAADA